MAKVLTLIYLATLAFWFFFARNPDLAQFGLDMQLLLFVIPFIGSIAGFYNAKRWDGFQSSLGKAVWFVSAGVLAWSIGMLIWCYYIFIAKVEIPYPSFADAAFILSWPLWTAGVIYLSQVTGVRFALKKLSGKILLVIVPLIAIAFSYWLLIPVARGGVIDFDPTQIWKLFFDLFYPIGDAVILTLAVTFGILSSGFLGGKYRTPVLVLALALVVNFAADTAFSYTTTNGTYFNGFYPDMLFATGLYLFSLSLALMNPKADSVQKQVTSATM